MKGQALYVCETCGAIYILPNALNIWETWVCPSCKNKMRKEYFWANPGDG